MILRNIAVRHGRRQLAAPVARSVLVRQLGTTSTATTQTAWPEVQTEKPAPPKIFTSSKKKKQNYDSSSISLSRNSGHEHTNEAWVRSHNVGGQELTPAEQYAEFQRLQSTTRSVGTRVERKYVPYELVANPPAPEDVTLELLMASQTHMGHNKSLWNPANARYIYGTRQGIHIISLEATAAHLRRAARVVEDVAYRGGLILFVGTKPGQMEIVTRAAELAGACHLYTKWIPGTITNRDVLLQNRQIKVVNGKDEELEGFRDYQTVARPLVPDLVVCLNPVENYTMLYECGLASVPTIGVIDTNANPSWVTYTIPANDDSLRSAAVIGGVLGRAGERGQKRRLDDAEKNNIQWQTPPLLQIQMRKEVSWAKGQRDAVIERMNATLVDFTEEERAILTADGVGYAAVMGQESESAAGEAGQDSTAAIGDVTAKTSEIEASLDVAKGDAAALESELADLKK